MHVLRVQQWYENGSLLNDEIVSGELTAGDIDSFVFDANAGEAEQIRGVDTDGNSFQPTIWLYNPDGTLNDFDWDGTTAELDCFPSAS